MRIPKILAHQISKDYFALIISSITGLIVAIVGLLITELIIDDQSVDLLETLVLHTSIISYIYSIFVAIVVYLAVKIGYIDHLLTHVGIYTDVLEELTKDSDLIIYTSYIPSFVDWYKPELINYLLKTSPKLMIKNNSSDDYKNAFRFFILPKKEWKYLKHESKDKSYTRNLASIHTELGIKTYGIDLEKILKKQRKLFNARDNKELKEKTPGYFYYDFAVGYTGCSNLAEVCLDKIKYIAYPVDDDERLTGKIKKVTNFRLIENNNYYKMYQDFIDNLLIILGDGKKDVFHESHELIKKING